ncbi:MAG: hypothetical protein ACTSPI_14250 [Candidatus Heimdallarchaeaceae archaeon]
MCRDIKNEQNYISEIKELVQNSKEKDRTIALSEMAAENLRKENMKLRIELKESKSHSIMSWIVRRKKVQNEA